MPVAVVAVAIDAVPEVQTFGIFVPVVFVRQTTIHEESDATDNGNDPGVESWTVIFCDPAAVNVKLVGVGLRT